MKILQKLSILLSLFLLGFGGINISHADLFEWGWSQSSSDRNLQTEDGNRLNQSWVDNEKLNNFQNGGINVRDTWEIGAKNAMIRIAKDLKNVFFFIASLYFLIIILKLLFSEKTEEEVSNFKKWGLWITIGLIVTQISYVFVEVLFDRWVSEQLAWEFAEKIFEPFIKLLETGASFFFIAIAVYAFYKLVTAGWNEDAAKEWKMSIVYAIIGFILVKITKTIVYTIYGKIEYDCSVWDIFEVWRPGDRADCLEDQNIDWFAEMVVNIINWANGFVGIIVVLLIIYAGARILLSRWDEESLTKAKSMLLYIFIGIWILVMNYLILTFFLIPETPITGA